MSRSMVGALVLFFVVLMRPDSVLAQAERVARAVSEVRYLGNEEALVHMAEEIGAGGISVCLERASRAGRVLCAQAARYLERPWAALPLLVTVLRDHDRQVASRAAESMVLILEGGAEDEGAHETPPAEVESLLDMLRETANVENLSPDIRVQVIAIYGALARLVSASLDVSRGALRDPEVALRRAAVGTLIGSEEPDDISALVEIAGRDDDLLVVSQATAGVCEVTLGAGRALPAVVEERVRELLANASARPSLMRGLLICLARSGDEQRTAELRALADRHPNEATRSVWAELRANGRAGGGE